MRAFAALLDRLVLTPQRTVKLRLMTDYFRDTPDPDRGFALAALTGDLDIPSVKPAMLRAMVTARVDEVLFATSYDYVGDLAETIALIWPAAEARRNASSPPPERGRWPGEAGSEGGTDDAPSPPLAAPPFRGGRRPAPASPLHRRRAIAGGIAVGRAASGGSLARPAQCVGALGADQARHRRASHRRLGAAGQTGGGRPRRPRGERDRGGVAWPDAAIRRPLRLAGRARTPTGIQHQGAVPAGYAGPGDRRGRPQDDHAGDLCRGVEMGRHPHPGGERGRRHAALYTHRRRHLAHLSRHRRGTGRRSRARWRTARRPSGRGRLHGAHLLRPATAAEPQDGDGEAACQPSGLPARL